MPLSTHAAPRAFSSGWFAAKQGVQQQVGQTGRLPNGMIAGIKTPEQQRSEANVTMQRSVANLGRTAAAIAAQQAAQAAARLGVDNAPPVKDGLAAGDGQTLGGLVEAVGTLAKREGIDSITRNDSKSTGGHEHIDIAQNAGSDRAIIHWETFNIGRNTTVQFQQKTTDAVLNRVVGREGAHIAPSQIQGAIQAEGTVLVVNQNGVVFSGSSQVNVRNLVAAAAQISDAQFLDRNKGLYADANGTQPSFVADAQALGVVQVQRGAQINTNATDASTATQGGGYVLLLGKEVSNAGQIATPNGQAVLAAGDSFYIRKGFGTVGNKKSTTRGNEVAAHIAAGSETTGKVINTGLITATTGDITLTGRDVQQAGVAVATSSTAVRGTIHLSTQATDGEGRVTLRAQEAQDAQAGQLLVTGGGTTGIVLETPQWVDAAVQIGSITQQQGHDVTQALGLDKAGAGLDSQRQASLEKLDGVANPLATGMFRNLSTAADLVDLSRVEIVSGGTVAFQDASLTLATGGQIVVSAGKRTLLDAGSNIDVSGAVGVRVDMSSNNLKIDVQGNELRDAPVNRDSDPQNNRSNLSSQEVWVDRRLLVSVAAGTNGYESQRWYTAGGLLEVSGYLGMEGRSIGEWQAQGGTVTVSGADLVTREGSRINLSGGTLDVQDGYLKQSWLRGENGRLYTVDRAPGDLLYKGLYKGYEQHSERWGQTRSFYNPLLAPRQRFEQGYTVGRDAGRLIVSTDHAVLEGDLVGEVYQGPRQVEKAAADLEGLFQSQAALARRGQLWVGNFLPIYDTAQKWLRYSPSATGLAEVVFGDVAAIAQGIALDDALPAEGDARQHVLHLDTARLNTQQLGGIEVMVKDRIQVQGALGVSTGGGIVLHAAAVEVDADLTAKSGRIELGNVHTRYVEGQGWQERVLAGSALDAEYVHIASGVTLDASGEWANLKLEPQRTNALAHVDGGDVSLRSRGTVTLLEGSVVDVQSGAALQQDGKLVGGYGGDVTLAAAVQGSEASLLTLDGDIKGYGVKGGGVLTIESGTAVGIGSGFLDADGVLKAGQEVRLGLTILEAIEVGLGEKLPADYIYQSTVVKPDEPLLSWLAGTGGMVGVDLILAEPIVLEGDWTIPAPLPRSGGRLYEYSVIVRDLDGQERVISSIVPMSGNQPSYAVIPKGWILIGLRDQLNSFPSDGTYVLPKGVFPDAGISVAAYDKTARAGTELAQEILQAINSDKVRFAPGTVLVPGSVLTQDVAVAPVLQLDPAQFRHGFSDYRVTGGQGLTVNDGAKLVVDMPVYRSIGNVQANRFQDALSLWDDQPLYLEDIQTRLLRQRDGASLTLSAGGGSSWQARPGSAIAWVHEGAAIAVDPGQSITIGSVGQLTVDGTLLAKGGHIKLHEISVQGVDNSSAAHSYAIQVRGTLDVSGYSHVAKAVDGSYYGVVYGGGRIEIGGTVDESVGRIDAGHLFVRIEDGAVLNASGASGMFTVPGFPVMQHFSDGGAISLASNSGLLIEGSLALGAGGGTAAGGSLTVALGSPVYRNDAKGAGNLLQPREMLLRQSSLDAVDDDALMYGQARLSADHLMQTGADNLTLFSNGLIGFETDVALSARQSVRLYASAITLAESASGANRVEVSAPYVRLAGLLRPEGFGGSDEKRAMLMGYLGRSERDANAQFLATAQLLDVRAQLGFGVRSTVGVTRVDRRGFSQVDLQSTGDLRFLQGAEVIGGISGQYTTQISAPDALTLAARQIYPVTGARTSVLVGDAAADGVLTIRRPDGALDDAGLAMPLSAFGHLSLEAARIEQQGVLRAPLGTLELGTQDSTRIINLHPQSVTSVSGAGLAMPYGGTADGLQYLLNGESVTLQAAASTEHGGIVLRSMAIDVREGAKLDLSGGGDLLGAGFVSGRGGSTDARFHPLLRMQANGSFTLPGLSSNAVYAIVPGLGHDYAPAGGDAGASESLVGQTITVGSGVPGLQPGSYTLLPSTYALMPGAFRVEIDGSAAVAQGAVAVAMRNGSYKVAGRLGIANTDIGDALARGVVLTSADVLRRYAKYDETSYAAFVLADAARKGIPRAALPADARTLSLIFGRRSDEAYTVGEAALHFDGDARFSPDQGGYAGSLMVRMTGDGGRGIEILADGQHASAEGYVLGDRQYQYLSIYASDLNAVGAPRMLIGDHLMGEASGYGQGGRYVKVGGNSAAGVITLRAGAILQASEVFLIVVENLAGVADRRIILEAGAGINTVGQGAKLYDSSNGYVYQPGGNSVLAVSNGWLDFMAPNAPDGAVGGQIAVGVCTDVIDCSRPAHLHSEGTITIATNKPIEIAESARYGTRNLVLAVGGVNVGSETALDAARLRGVLPAGLTLNQSVLNRLLRGDQDYGAPALESLILTARTGFNFFESATLSTLGAANGQSSLANLVLTAPAIYGYGSADDVALIQTRNLIWNGSDVAPPAPVVDGVGTGSGRLEVQAQMVQFGYADRTPPDALKTHARSILGFADVRLDASERVTANYKGNLSVHQSRDDGYVAGEGYQYRGGNLTIATPLLTTQAGAELAITAGGDLRVQGGLAGDTRPSSDALGGVLSLQGKSLTVDSAIVLPSGQLTLTATDSLSLNPLAYLDVSGRKVTMFDVNQYSWGGDITLESLAGDITQSAESTINLSAAYNRGGLLTAVALHQDAGLVDLQGRILGAASGEYDAGGTWVPYLNGGVEIRAQRLSATESLDSAFAALNSRLNQGEVFGSRSFQFKRGSLTVADGVKANEVAISVDDGHLAVTGLIDASGEQVGSIRLSARQGLTLAGNAVLDAHGRRLRLDSYETIIDSPNRAIVELNAGEGLLALQDGVRIDLRHGTDDARVQARPGLHDGRDRGTLVLNVARLGSGGQASDADAATYGDVALQAGQNLTIAGAKSIAVNAVQRYSDAVTGTEDSVLDGAYQIINQAYLDEKHEDSRKFIDAALGGGLNALTNRLAGLYDDYRNVLHLRPGVDIVSATPDGHLVVQGDLDLSGYRYDSLNPLVSRVAGAQPGDDGYGSGEPGALTLRAGGNLEIYGSITDGFVPPETELDTDGWVLVEGVQPFAADVVVPRHGIELKVGTTLPKDSTLNYDLPAGWLADVTLPAGTLLPVDVQLPDGTMRKAGTVLDAAVTAVNLSWPKGEPLPERMTLKQALTLKLGALIPTGSNLKLGLASGQVIALNNTNRKNWAVAKMLPAGALSWDMRLAAGADTAAADPRLAVQNTAGNVTLADTHYSLSKIIEREVISVRYFWPDVYVPTPEQPNPPTGSQGFSPGREITNKTAQGRCDSGRYVCVKNEELGPPVVKGVSAESPVLSVLRTGTGDLDLAASGDVTMRSAYGLYTAGTDAVRSGEFGDAAFYRARGNAAVDGTLLGSEGGDYEAFALSQYQAWYPEQGGNVYVSAGGSLRGHVLDSLRTDGRQPLSSAALGNWLWRQGTGQGSGADDVPAAWWINFGAYVTGGSTSAGEKSPYVAGFTGIGALGGGNVNVRVGGDTGTMDAADWLSLRSDALVAAAAGTGRVLQDGQLRLTGGGDVVLRIGGAFNALSDAARDTALGLVSSTRNGLAGAIINLRGHVSLAAAALGAVAPVYGRTAVYHDKMESRAYDPYQATKANALGGLMLVPGDSTFSIEAFGDLVLGGVVDPGRTPLRNAVPFTVDGQEYQGGVSSFSLWTDHTAISLFTSGGDLVPGTQVAAPSSVVLSGRDYSPTDGRFVYPSRFSAVAASGNLYLGESATGLIPTGLYPEYSLLLAPHAEGDGWLSLLAGQSIYGGGYAVNRSGAASGATSSPWNVAFRGADSGAIIATNYRTEGVAGSFPLFVFGGDTNAGLAVNILNPARFYAVGGDIIGLMTGEEITFGRLSVRADSVWYEAAGVVRMLAAGDIVGSGTELGPALRFVPGAVAGRAGSGATANTGVAVGNLIVHSSETDVSVVSAGGSILHSSFRVAGPGTLEITAGGSIRMDELASVVSIGQVSAEDFRPGASIVLQAGLNPRKMETDYTRFLAKYLNPDSQADLTPGVKLADQPGKVAQVYGGALTLADWLRQQFGYAGDESGAAVWLERHQVELNTRDGTQRNLRNEYGQASQTYLLQWLSTRYAQDTGLRFADDGTPVVFDVSLLTNYARMDAQQRQEAVQTARQFFDRLAPEQQRILARDIYFTELKAGGREYNDVDGPRPGSYLRGRQAVAALFPDTDALGRPLPVVTAGSVQAQDDAGNPVYAVQGKQLVPVFEMDSQGLPLGAQLQTGQGLPMYAYQGDVTMYAGTYEVEESGKTVTKTRSGHVHTRRGGNVQMIAPGGGITLGVEGITPPTDSGVITQGRGNIQSYAFDSILLGQSRMMTTFGGNILGWSALGDINAGRGSKTALVYTPPLREYDSVGNVTLSSDVPSAGSGIATDAPIAGVDSGDVDLIAPEGTIDAGEAGIRSSGSVNVAALQVLNADNIKAQGEATGVPVVAAVNTGALTQASSAATAAATAAQETVQRSRAETRQNLPSIITVQILGFGNEAMSGAPSPAPAAAADMPRQARYRPDGIVRVASPADLSAQERTQLGL